MKKLFLLFALSLLEPLSAFADDTTNCSATETPSDETTIGSDNRWTISFTLTGENNNSLTIQTGEDNYHHPSYIDAKENVLKVEPGEKLTLSYVTATEADAATGETIKGGLSAYLYIDYNKDGYITFNNTSSYYHSRTEDTADDNELVTFNAYRWNSTEGYLNSNGVSVKDVSPAPGSWFGEAASAYIPKFTLPNLSAGKYLARFKTDWNTLECPGDVGKNNGVLIDFYIEIEAPTVPAAVNIEQPEINGCSLKVFNTSVEAGESSVVASGDELYANQLLKIVPTCADEYFVKNVMANGEPIAGPSEDGYYYYTTNGTAVTFSATFLKKSEQTYAVTYSQSGDDGTMTVKCGDSVLASGDEVTYGEEITVKVSYAFDSTVTINGTAANGHNGVYTYTVTTPTTILAALTRKYSTATGQTTSSDSNDRYITSITISGESNNSLKIETGASNRIHDYWLDKTDNVLIAKAGETITLRQDGVGAGMTSHLFIDYSDNGEFDNYQTDQTYYTDTTTEKDAYNELVTFNGHRWGSSSSTNNLFYDSKGNNLSTDPRNWGLNSVVTYDGSELRNASECIPTFTIPTDLGPGKYYARFTANWNEFSPTADCRSHNGVVIDFVIEVPRTVSVATSEKSGSFGSVAIASANGKEVSNGDDVTIIATPVADNKDIKFMCWTNANNDIVSRDATYTYYDLTSDTFTAHFGYQVNVVEVKNGGGNIVISKKNKFGGENQQKARTANVADDAESEDTSDSEELDNISISDGNGDVLEAGETYYINAESTSGNRIVYVYVRNEETDATHNTETYSYSDEEVTAVSLPITLDGPKNVAVQFWSTTTGVENVGIERSNDGYIEYYNINGTRVDGGNLAPGLYIVRNGNKVNKLLVK